MRKGEITKVAMDYLRKSVIYGGRLVDEESHLPRSAPEVKHIDFMYNLAMQEEPHETKSVGPAHDHYAQNWYRIDKNQRAQRVLKALGLAPGGHARYFNGRWVEFVIVDSTGKKVGFMGV